MLQSLHGAATKWVGMLLFTLLVLSFVIWGIADVFRDRVPKNVVAQVGPLEVTGQQLQNEVQRDLTYMRNLTGRSLTLQQALESGMVTRTLNNLIDRALLEQEAQRLGLRVPTSVVLDAIRGIPDFKTETGGFDADRFKGALANIGMSEQTFLFDQRINLAREQLAAASSAAVTVPFLLQKALAVAGSEKRTIETYRVKLADQKLPTPPDDATLQKYLEDNRDAFMRPAYRKLSFIKLTSADVADEVKVTDEEVTQAFETRKGELAQPEKRSFVQALTTSEEKAKAIVAASAGKDLIAAAKANGVTTTQLNNVAKDDLPADLQEAGFNLSAKSVSKPIQSGLGYHILQLTNIAAGHEATLEASRKKLTEELNAQKAADALIKRTQQADDLAASGAPMDEIAQNLGLVLQQTPLIDAAGKDQKGNSVTIAPEALIAAGKLPEGQTTGLIAAPSEQYYIVRIDTLQEAALKPLAEVKPQVIAVWQKDQQQTAAQQQADKIVKALKAGHAFEAILKMDFKVESAIEKDLTRSAALPAYLPANFSSTAFSLKKGEVAQAPGKDALVVVRVAGISLPVTVETAKVPADVNASEVLKDALNGDLLTAYSAALRQRYPVKVEEGKIAQLFIDKTQQE